MDNQPLSVLQSFTISSLPDLDIAVLGALALFQKNPPQPIVLDMYTRPLVVGSGNAAATGRIVFRAQDAVFASESTYEETLRSIPAIDGVVLISASGEKHAPIIARRAREMGKHVTLITNTKESAASRELDGKHAFDEFVFPKNREPYTYNTSTYMGMILGSTQEDPAAVADFITTSVAPLDYSLFSGSNKYYFIIPPRFTEIIRMLHIKFIELFGRRIARDIESSEYVKHATTVVPSEDEVFVSFGEKNSMWGDPAKRIYVPLPENADYGAMMAIGYYVIAQIQKQHPPYFKDNLVLYAARMPEIFGTTLSPIVEA